MMSRMVSLLRTVLAIAAVNAQFDFNDDFSGLGGLGGIDGGLGGLSGLNALGISGGSGQSNPLLMTCINADSQDPQSQIRLTLSPIGRSQQSQFGGLNGLGVQFPGGPGGFPGRNFPGSPGGNNQQNLGISDTPLDWSVDGILLPSTLVNKAGQYQVGIFEGGRTFGSCKMSALGKVLSAPNPLIQAAFGALGGAFGGQRPGFPGGQGFPGTGFNSPMNPLLQPYSAALLGSLLRSNQQPVGVVSNPARVSTGTTVYSGAVRGLTYNQLVGRSIGVCQSLQTGQCMGLIAYCCSIVRDSISADQVYLDPAIGSSTNTFSTGLDSGTGGISGVGSGNAGSLFKK